MLRFLLSGTAMAGIALALPAVAQTQMPAQAPIAPAALTLLSPDNAIALTLTAPADGAPRYSITRHAEAVIAPSPLGFNFTDVTRTDAMTMVEASRTSIDRQLPVIAGKTAAAHDHYNEMVVRLSDPAAKMPAIELIVRAYDDAVAFRYRIKGGAGPLSIWGERTGFYLPGDNRCWGSMVGSYTSSHESEFDAFSPAKLRPYQLYDTGLLCKTNSGATSFLITEADLNNYAGMYMRGREDGGSGFDTTLAPLPGESRVAVRSAAGQDVTTPWRVVMMSDRAGDLIAANTIGNLNPAAAGDWSWVKPGKAAWDWWSGPYFPDQKPGPMTMAGIKRLIDFAGQSGLPYMLIDEGWALNSGFAGSAPADTDILKTQPGLDMPELVRYAKMHNVDLLLWLQWSQLDARMSEAMDQYARWGIKGIKVDFMDRNDVGMVDYYHRILQEAAKRHLMVDLHGAYHPTGLARTYPNYVTQEGVMGAEYNKWSRRITATHNVNLTYTRMVLGPMDYTPGGFRNRTPANFQISPIPPQVQTTRGQALAMYVVYESTLQMVADSPDVYAGQAEFAFIRDVPTVWDETRFLDGDIDSHVVVARRKGKDWWIGAMNTETARPIQLPLSFLGNGRFTAEIWQDGASPAQTVKSERIVNSGDSLSLSLAGSGGAAIHLRPAR